MSAPSARPECPVCRGPRSIRYPGGDPENDSARWECLDRECQRSQDLSAPDCPGCSCCDVNPHALKLAAFRKETKDAHDLSEIHVWIGGQRATVTGIVCSSSDVLLTAEFDED